MYSAEKQVQADLASACELGFLECLEESSDPFEQSYRFLIKSFQEHCAGHYLASLAIENLTYCIKNLDRQCVLLLQRVFIVASGASKAACQEILKRIVEIHQNKEDDSIAIERSEQGFITDNFIDDLIYLALQCNMECDSQGLYNSILEKLLPQRCINVRGVPSMPSISYFFRYLGADAKIKSISVTLGKCSTYESTEINLFEAIETGIQREKNAGDCEREKTSPNTIPFDVYGFFVALKFTLLLSLLLNKIHLHGYIHNFVNLIKEGYLHLLEELEFCHAQLTEGDLKIMTPLGILKRLRVLNLSQNKAGSGLPTLIDALNIQEGTSTIEEVDFSHMEASPDVTNYIKQKLMRLQLKRLKLHGNEVNEESGEIMMSALSSAEWCLLKSLSVSVRTLSNSIIATLVTTLTDLKHLCELQIFDSFDAEYLLGQIVHVLRVHVQLDTLLLGANSGLREEDVASKFPRTWTQFAEALQYRSNMKSLTLVGIPLHAVDLQRALHLFKRQRYRWFG